MQSILKGSSTLAERVGQGEVDGYTALADSAWQPLQLSVEKKALVNDGWAICLPSCTNGCRQCSFHLVRTPFLPFKAAFSPEECCLVGGP